MESQNTPFVFSSRILFFQSHCPPPYMVILLLLLMTAVASNLKAQTSEWQLNTRAGVVWYPGERMSVNDLPVSGVFMRSPIAGNFGVDLGRQAVSKSNKRIYHLSVGYFFVDQVSMYMTSSGSFSSTLERYEHLNRRHGIRFGISATQRIRERANSYFSITNKLEMGAVFLDEDRIHSFIQPFLGGGSSTFDYRTFSSNSGGHLPWDYNLIGSYAPQINYHTQWGKFGFKAYFSPEVLWGRGELFFATNIGLGVMRDF